MSDYIPDYNLFMMCERLNQAAMTDMPQQYKIRLCRKNELWLWKSIHFDDANEAKKYSAYMTKYFQDVYQPNEALFWEHCLFACDQNDHPIATCFSWKAYGEITTIHWFKVKKEYEGRGIGRALLSKVMGALEPSDYPVYLHTQPGSYQAIKLYTDFGFSFLTEKQIGPRSNDIALCLPILKRVMPPQDYARLQFAHAPESFLKAVNSSDISQF